MVTPSFGVSRTFDTTLERLWTAFTDSADLAAWYMPPGARLLQNDMNLAAGGTYRYGLALPDGTAMWGQWEFRRVEPPSLLTFRQYFTDAKGNMTRNPHDPDWPRWLKSECRFALQGGGATATINLAPEDPAEAEISVFRRGFPVLSQGWERMLDVLDTRLASQAA